MVGIHVGHDMSTVRYIQRHIHPEAIDGRACDSSLRSITEISEFHKVIQLVIGSNRCITQDITHISSTQHIQTATHIEVFQRTVHHGKYIHKSLAVSHTLSMLFGANNLEVLSPHTHIDRNVVRIVEVDTTLHIQRVVVMRIDGEILKQQVRMLNAYGVVVKT